VFLLFAWGLGRLFRDGTLPPVTSQLVAAGLRLQLVLALLLLEVPWMGHAFLVLNRGFEALQAASDAGTTLVFGYLGGGPPPFVAFQPDNSFILAFPTLPMVLIVGALTSLHIHWGILQRVNGTISFALMAVGMAGIAGTVMAVYAAVLGPVLPRGAGPDHRRLDHQLAGRPGRRCADDAVRLRGDWC
jgi:CNT family concentrative nucleoside transporter